MNSPMRNARVIALFAVRGSGTPPEANLRVGVRRLRGVYEAAIGTLAGHAGTRHCDLNRTRTNGRR
jgi:hypothetical protein